MVRDLAIVCDAPGCVRGLIRNMIHGDDWPQACRVCGGRGSISIEALCKRIGECDTTVRRVLKQRTRMRPKVAARICGKLIDLIEPPKETKQKEMFA